MRTLLEILRGIIVLAGFIVLTAGAAEDAPTVRIGVPPWQGAVVKAAVVGALLERQGYRIEQVQAAPALLMQGMVRGDVDVYLSAWVPGQEAAFSQLVEDGKIHVAGQNLTGARTGLAVPAAVYREGVSSLSDLASHPERFARTIYCIEPGSGANAVAEAAIAEDLYNLGDWRLMPSSTEAMLSQVGRAIDREQAMVFCAWSPHWMNVSLSIRYLDDPLDHWGAEGRTQVLTLYRSGLEQEHPALVKFLGRFQIGAAEQSDWIEAYAQRSRLPEEIAADWVKANSDRIAGWFE
jgi:glycine betaine/proline transport system substrate-binding protein